VNGPEETLEALEDLGWEEREVFWKRGRSRAYRREASQEASGLREEAGGAVGGEERRTDSCL